MNDMYGHGVSKCQWVHK